MILQSIADRVVQRSALEILQPLLDPRFDARSFGFRPGLGPWDAMIAAETLCRQQARHVWVLADIEAAFTNVRLPRLLDIVRSLFRDERLVLFLDQITSGASLPGLRQGGCLSPLLLNLFLDHFLDRPWRRRMPTIPLIRFADDILLLCESTREAREAHDALAQLIYPTGLRLNPNKTEIRTLSLDDPATWLGLRMTRQVSELEFGLTDEFWSRFAADVAQARVVQLSPDRLHDGIVGWINYAAPCYPHVDFNEVYARIVGILEEHGFPDILTFIEFNTRWGRAHSRWQTRRAEASAAAGRACRSAS